tara:strand:- start:21823 stop:23949 length:2127 start_codon:yes stop_codon:yes gene_type:complete
MPTQSPNNPNRQPEYCWTGYDGQATTAQITLWECGACGYGSFGSVNEEQDPETGCRQCSYLYDVFENYEYGNSDILSGLILSHCASIGEHGDNLELFMWDNHPDDGHDGIDSGAWVYCEGNSNQNCNTNIIGGCMDTSASNYDRNANVDDNSCLYGGDDGDDAGGIDDSDEDQDDDFNDDLDDDGGSDNDDNDDSDDDTQDPPSITCICAPTEEDNPTRDCDIFYDDCGCAFQPICNPTCEGCSCEPSYNACECSDGQPNYNFCVEGFEAVCDGCSNAPGDTNGDGTINVQDIITLLPHVLYGEELDECVFQAGDINQDGGVNVLDLVAISNIILNGMRSSDNDLTEIKIIKKFVKNKDLQTLQNDLNNLISSSPNKKYKSEVKILISNNQRDCNCTCEPIFENNCENQGLITCPISLECVEDLSECPLCEDQNLNDCPNWATYQCWAIDESECIEDCPECPPEWYYTELLDIQGIMITEFSEYVGGGLEWLSENLQTNIDGLQSEITSLETTLVNTNTLLTENTNDYELLANYLGLSYQITDGSILPNYDLTDNSLTCTNYLDPLTTSSYCLDSTACDGLSDFEIISPVIYIQPDRFTGVAIPSTEDVLDIATTMSNSFFLDEGLTTPCTWCDGTSVTNDSLSGPGTNSDYYGGFSYLSFFETIDLNPWSADGINFQNGAYYFISTLSSSQNNPAGCCTAGYFKITI